MNDQLPAVGDTVALKGRRGTFKIRGYSDDGTVAELWGGVPGKERYRSVSITQLTQPRERAVRCSVCYRTMTWDVTGVCSACADPRAR